MTVRSPTKSEITILKRTFNKWGVFDYFAGKTLFIDTRDGTNFVCVLSKDLQSAMPLEKISHCGLQIGELRKQFLPSVAGADLFVRAGSPQRNCVTVSDFGEELVLYGRDVMGNSVVSASEDLEENEVVILIGGNGRAIGVGRTRFNGTRLKEPKTVTITTLQDAGKYLREEGN